MAGVLESEAYFRSRMEQIGIGDLFESMKNLGFATFANFAFSSSFVRGATRPPMRSRS